MGRETFYDLLLDFDLDRYLNPYIPHNRFNALPKPIRHFLGTRDPPCQEPPALIRWIVVLIATVAGLSTTFSVFTYAPAFASHRSPVLVASFGASAILCFNTVRSPLAQPRNAVLGHCLAAIVGVGIAKLFQLHSNFENTVWVSGAVGCACASLAMSLTNTVHPPGGATAVLASTEPAIVALGWFFVVFVLVGSVLMTTVACLLNNVFRQYPMYWWTPDECGSRLPFGAHHRVTDANSLEKQYTKQLSVTDSDRSLRRETSRNVDFVEGVNEVRLQSDKIQLPSHIILSDADTLLLEKLQGRLRLHEERRG